MASNEFVVDEILARNGNNFLVRWVGYDGQDSWEPLGNVKGCSKYYAFIKEEADATGQKIPRGGFQAKRKAKSIPLTSKKTRVIFPLKF